RKNENRAPDPGRSERSERRGEPSTLGHDGAIRGKGAPIFGTRGPVRRMKPSETRYGQPGTSHESSGARYRRPEPRRALGVGYPLLVLAAAFGTSPTRSQCTLTYPEPVRATRRGAARTRSGDPAPGAGYPLPNVAAPIARSR